MTTIHEALLAVRHEVGAIGKGSFNDFHKFRFRGIEEILNKVGPALLSNGVNVAPELRSLDSRDITTEKGKKNREVTVIVAYHYRTADWQRDGDPEFVAVVPGESSDGGASAVSKAMSVAMRIAHLQALQIPTAMTDPEAGSLVRADDPVLKVKQQIAAEAEKREWVLEDGSYQALLDDFTEWSQGAQLADAEVAVLNEYLVHLRPNRKMSRAKPAGAQ